LSKLFVCLLVLFCSTAIAVPQECSPPKVQANYKAYNIFTPDQEMILGELTYQRMTRDLRVVKDRELTAHINNIGEKLIKHLPSTGLKYQFHIIDLPEANAFNIPGGYVFVSRKLIGFVHNEDELAGVIAHELGHAVVRHGASDFSELLKKVLNVTQLGDRKDVIDKYNLFLERARTKNISQRQSHENEQQLEADRIGLFAMIAAGYNPTAFGDFFSRLVETKEKTGNWFTDTFGKLKPEEKRLREMIKVSDQLPAQCRDSRTRTASEKFLSWQAAVVSFRDANRAEELPSLLWKKELTPKLRSDISHFAFSDDGKYLLAQDDFAITVIRREPLEVEFQIPASDAEEASFTPDSQFVVFGTEDLRFEKWSVIDRKSVAVRELVVRRDCWEHAFSPNGEHLVCVDYGMNLNVLETESGKKVWEKKDYYELSFWEYLAWIGREAAGENKRNQLFNIAFSPDSKIAAISRSNKARFRFSVDGVTEAKSEDTLLALNLTTLKPINTKGDLKKFSRRPFLFLDSNRILALGTEKLEDAGIFSFPEGKRLAKFSLSAEELKRTWNPNYVVVKPLANARMGFFDLSRHVIASGLNKADATLWNNSMVSEGVSGKLMVSDVQYDETRKLFERKEFKTLEIPVGPLGRIQAGSVSDNFGWLTVSSKTRGALWELNSGERKVFVRGFRGVLMAADGGAIGDFPKLDETNHSLALLDPSKNDVQPFREIPEKGARQYGSFVLIRQSLREEKKEEKKPQLRPFEEEPDESSLRKEVRFELRGVINDKLIWSREFPREAPGLFFDEFSGRLILHWTLRSDAGKARLKEDPALDARAKQLENKDDDYFIEIIDAFAATTVGTLLIETGKRSFDIASGFSEGDWLVLGDSRNRVLIYSIKGGDIRHRFFGSDAAINPSRKQIVVENYPGELTIYDLNTGENQARLVFNKDAVLIRFSLDGKRLFVLSAEQKAYAFDVEKLIPAGSSPRF